MKTTKVALLGLFVLVSACGTMPHDPARHHRGHAAPRANTFCGGASCQITVTATTCEDVDSPDIVVARGNRNMNLVFHAPAGFTFARNGVVVQGDVHREFTYTHGPRTFTVHNKHDREGLSYKYDVRLERDGTPCRPLDPWIAN